jgi:hypothetical protein
VRNDLGVCAGSADSGTWKPDLVAPLAGHDIVILPDADASGEVRAREAAMALHNIAASVRVVRLSGLGHKEQGRRKRLAGSQHRHRRRLYANVFARAVVAHEEGVNGIELRSDTQPP